MKQNKAATFPLTKTSNASSQSFSMDTKGPLNPASEGK